MGGCFSASDTRPAQSATYGAAPTSENQEALKFALNRGGEEGLVSQIELHMSCAGLKNVDVGSLTDSACVVYMKNNKNGLYEKLGQTEVITDNLNPAFVKSVVVDFYFEERQDMRISVFDIDDFKSGVVEQNLLGSVDFRLDQVSRAPNGTLALEIKAPVASSEKLGDVVIRGEELKKHTSRSYYKIKFEGVGFPCHHLFYRLSRLLHSLQYAAIYESETSAKGPDGKHAFKEAKVHSAALLEDDESRKAMIEVFQWERSGSHVSLGKHEFVIGELVERIPIKLPCGATMSVLYCDKQEEYSFLDYVFNGLEISLHIAVDFTLSNKDPSDPSSLHYFDLTRNQYLQAISNVGQVLENYDSDKKFTLLGFGAKVPFLLDKTSHCFALNGDIFKPEVAGIQGVIETYKNVLHVVKLNGPTFFARIIAYLNALAECEVIQGGMNKYYILLIITDGLINDMNETVDEIVRASGLPISIIIVGVGDEDFSSMEVLDADKTPLYSQKMGKVMDRDIVQFVPFREYRSNPIELAKKTLEEIPRQLVSYMNSKGLQPKREMLANPAKVVNFSEMRLAAFTQTLLTMGFSEEKIKEILGKGLPEEDVDLFRIQAFNPSFRNFLAEATSYVPK